MRLKFQIQKGPLHPPMHNCHLYGNTCPAPPQIQHVHSTLLFRQINLIRPLEFASISNKLNNFFHKSQTRKGGKEINNLSKNI